IVGSYDQDRDFDNLGLSGFVKQAGGGENGGDTILCPSWGDIMESCSYGYVQLCYEGCRKKIFSWWNIRNVNALSIEEFFPSMGMQIFLIILQDCGKRLFGRLAILFGKKEIHRAALNFVSRSWRHPWDPVLKITPRRASAMADTTPLVTTVTKPAINPGEADTTPRVNIQKFCEEYYEDILPIIIEKVRHDRRKDVHNRLNFGEGPRERIREDSHYSNTRARAIEPERVKVQDRLRYDGQNGFQISPRGRSRARALSASREDRHKDRECFRGTRESYGDSFSHSHCDGSHHHHMKLNRGRRKLANSKNLVYTPTLPSGKSTILSSGPGSSGCSASGMPYSEVNSSRVAVIGKLSVTAKLSCKPEEVATPCAGGYRNLRVNYKPSLVKRNNGARDDSKTSRDAFSNSSFATSSSATSNAVSSKWLRCQRKFWNSSYCPSVLYFDEDENDGLNLALQVSDAIAFSSSSRAK
nr:hypothetical protein [Tanacetum cinerariifolium]